MRPGLALPRGAHDIGNVARGDEDLSDLDLSSDEEYSDKEMEEEEV